MVYFSVPLCLCERMVLKKSSIKGLRDRRRALVSIRNPAARATNPGLRRLQGVITTIRVRAPAPAGNPPSTSGRPGARRTRVESNSWPWREMRIVQ